MPGQATVSINGNQWSVSLATTYAELTTGLRGISSLASGTGMLFVLPSEQEVSVDTTGMSFALDIIFVSNDTVIDVARNVQPDYLVTEETPCDMFLEVSAGEAISVESGDSVSTATIQQGMDFSQIMSFAAPLAALGFVCAMAGGMARMMAGSSHSSSSRHPSKPEEATFPPEARKDLTFCKHMWELEKTMGRSLTREEVAEKWEAWKKLRYCPKTEEERKLSHEMKYGTEELPERGQQLSGKLQPGEKVWVTIAGKEEPAVVLLVVKEDSFIRYRVERPDGRLYTASLGQLRKREEEHHSMWMTVKQREECEKLYGAVACRWGEELAAVGDFETVKRAAKKFYARMREAVGIA